jgi:hypothetical protein
MHINQWEKAVVVIQQGHPVFDGTQVVSNSQDASRLCSGQDSFSISVAHKFANELARQRIFHDSTIKLQIIP